MTVTTTTLDRSGRVMLPAEVRRELHLNEGDLLQVKVRNGEIVLVSRSEAIRRAQNLFLSIDPGGNWSSELIDDQRLEAKSEVVR